MTKPTTNYLLTIDVEQDYDVSKFSLFGEQYGKVCI